MLHNYIYNIYIYIKLQRSELLQIIFGPDATPSVFCTWDAGVDRGLNQYIPHPLVGTPKRVEEPGSQKCDSTFISKKKKEQSVKI